MKPEEHDDGLNYLQDLWQQETSPLLDFREDARKKARLSEYSFILSSLALIAGLIFVLVRGWQSWHEGAYFMVIISLSYVPVALYLLKTIRMQWMTMRTTMPLSIRGYVSHMTHNLESEREQLRWTRALNTWLPLYMIILALLRWLEYGFTHSLFFAICAMSLFYLGLLYYTLIYAPERLARKQRSLDEVKASVQEEE